MKQYKVGLVGIGAVGTEMIKVLRQRKFPASEIRVLATRERDEEIAGETFHVLETTPEAFDGLDIAFFAGTEGSKGASKQFGWEAVERGVVVIDNGDDYRMDERVPLVIPEINAEALDRHQGFIANPNCSTIITLMGIAPLHKQVPLRHMTAVTFQSVSGTGRAAVEELEQQARAYATGAEMAVNTYPHQIAFNVLPQIGGLKKEMPGFTSEEAKLTFESRKILGCPDLRIACTCVRVPVFYAHSIAIHAEFSAPISAEQARDILSRTEGVKVIDDVATAQYPMPLFIGGGDDVGVGRIRVDPSVENGLALWCCGDNIRKGAAQNAVQIAETMIRRGLI
ncbi:MAG: aspartate-semialdehyde dehydrogenase [Kiritimatiellae bacterium]|jgi:aspartate-semialdehyde dehydrogenase|nr:aspartate-semialdehyde dehydrogenase [Kiritimatiellia bacterium]MDD2347410.1 aspartate-semialdehyde dehydrogenase [Kiritimatiellia bacterium]MDD3583375.1 aspartate-semialdehyde dehydrogenase [Kiritimatiellia bacterium]HHU15563.1 aspartate-semialdehyde dehydrogenase [Lentisphaerota bacterium]HON48251.1 aspartate-semialdehyde dehydrogenase [Kiritimatiellia bacterium]